MVEVNLKDLNSWEIFKVITINLKNYPGESFG